MNRTPEWEAKQQGEGKAPKGKKPPFPEEQKTSGVIMEHVTLTEENFLNLCYERDDLNMDTTEDVLNYIIEDYFND